MNTDDILTACDAAHLDLMRNVHVAKDRTCRIESDVTYVDIDRYPDGKYYLSFKLPELKKVEVIAKGFTDFKQAILQAIKFGSLFKTLESTPVDIRHKDNSCKIPLTFDRLTFVIHYKGNLAPLDQIVNELSVKLMDGIKPY